MPSYVRQTLKRKANEKRFENRSYRCRGNNHSDAPLLLPPSKIAGIVKTEGNKMLNAQFDFKKLNISLFRNFPQASVTLEDFWLKGAGEFANDTLVQAGEVTATINLFSLFGDSGYDISKVFIEDTRLHAIVLPDVMSTGIS